MRAILLLVVFLEVILFPGGITCKAIYTGQENVSLINTIEGKNCFISYVSIDGKTYLIKQKKDYKKQLAVIRDALAAYVAKTISGIAHEIEIVSADQQCYGKIKQSWPATLHTIAKGETVRKQSKCKYNALRLRQWLLGRPDEEQGLTKTIIEYMTWHPQLADIIALDLYIGNGDRHCGNLCYDADLDCFCAIDMDDSFNKDLCELACERLRHMVYKEKVVFTKDELRALVHMKNTLKLLVTKHTPFNLIQKLHFFARKAGFVKGNVLYNERIEKKLLSYEEMIIQSHRSAYQLIALIDKIVHHPF
jgi:hypothetical protein